MEVNKALMVSRAPVEIGEKVEHLEQMEKKESVGVRERVEKLVLLGQMALVEKMVVEDKRETPDLWDLKENKVHEGQREQGDY